MNNPITSSEPLDPEPHVVTIYRGNAMVAYHVVDRLVLNTEFGAWLYGRMSCQDDQYKHWINSY